MKRYASRPCEMWQLRLIIILIGVVFIALVYLLSRQHQRRRAKAPRQEPSLTDGPSPATADAARTPAVTQALNTRPGTAPTDGRQLIQALHVVCSEPDGFDGGRVLGALQANGLRYGQYLVFHRLTKSEPQHSVFSVASLIEPGVLPPETLPHQRLPGLTLFLVLPGPQDGVAACADMLATARALARQLGGSVHDEHHQPLTVESAQRIRQRILDFQQPLAASG